MEKGEIGEGVVEVRGEDLRAFDFSGATVIYVYLLAEGIALIEDRLAEALRGGARVVCNTWGPKGWTPAREEHVGAYGNVRLLCYDATSLP